MQTPVGQGLLCLVLPGYSQCVADFLAHSRLNNYGVNEPVNNLIRKMGTVQKEGTTTYDVT